MDSELFKKFSPHLKKALVDAEKIASERNSALDTEHQLLSLLQNKETLAFEILTSFDITAERIELIASLIGHKEEKQSTITGDAKKSIQLAVHSASKYHHLTIGSEHLLLALVSSKTFNSYIILERIGVEPKKIKKQIDTIFSGINNTLNKPPIIRDEPFASLNNMSIEEGFEENVFMNQNPIGPMAGTAVKQKKESLLDSFATNLTRLAEKNKLDPVIGREKEISRMIQTLSRRTKNNPVLVGEPGVGKTAIVEGLAQQIVGGKVPEKLHRTEILSLDLGSILAGTMYRGQFESRIKKILAEIEKLGNIILFVDEIHMMVGAGSTEGSIDAANLLKPMLAKGTLRLIGATTFDEYKKHIEKDPAFERRFQKVAVTEPTVLETVTILKGIKGRYEKFHNVEYDDSTIIAAAELAKRYINDRFLPDKAIDLLDEAGASANTGNFTPDPHFELNKKLESLIKRKETAILNERYEEAAILREQEIKLLLEINNTKVTILKKKKLITEKDVANLVSEWTGIPATKLTSREKINIINLEKKLNTYIIGQTEATFEVAKAIKRARVGIGNPDRPIGSFIFLGPTGVGKTELAKILAKEIFNNENALVKIDMSEFMERHNISRLVGAPAGYIGYEEGGKLTEAVRRNPYSVILFDEIEKAHPEVFNILLQIMDEGSLTDAKGRKVDFKNTIIIMTSNLGSDLLRQSAIGFNQSGSNLVKYEKLKESILETIEKTFRPEFLNRLDKAVIFMPLDEKAIRKIVDLQIDELHQRLLIQKLKLQISKEVGAWIAKESFKPEFGARPIRKFIADHIETKISDALLKEQYKTGDVIKIELKDGKLSLG